MVSHKEEETTTTTTTTLYGFKLSSVGPSKVTGSDVVHVPTSMDLAMKLHYLRGVYYFNHSDIIIQDLTITKIKQSLFNLCNHFYFINGRLRRASLAAPTDGLGALGSKEGRPYIKCNDCGVRFIEAKCSMSLNEWLDQLRACDDQISTTPTTNGDFHKQLVSGQFIGPELGFSPLVFMQFTSFKCGGMSIGLSFAHILGDIFSVSHFINLWGQLLSGKNPTPKLDNMLKVHPEHPNTFNKEPDTIKRIEPVGDNWEVNNCKMVKHSFHITRAQIEQFQAHEPSVGPFEAICSFIWKQIAKIREGSDVRKVTVCRNGYPVPSGYNTSNNQIISMVAANFEVKEASLKELAKLLANQTKDDNKLIEQVVETDPGASDFIVYGANLTFADCTQAALYDLEFKGQKPVLVNYSVDSIGNNGLVLVLPAPPKDGGRIATVVLPEKEMLLLKNEMRSNGGMVY